MIPFLKLTELESREVVFVNMETVESIAVQKNHTVLVFPSTLIRCRETPNQIFQMLASNEAASVDSRNLDRSPSLYLIWSNEHRAWWGPQRSGYVLTISAAGRYLREEALEICRNAIPGAGHLGHLTEIPVALRDMKDFLENQITPIPI